MDFEVGRKAIDRMMVRASCRVFKDKEIPEVDLEQVLKTGIRAASGGNLQPYSIIVVKDEKKNKQLADLCGGQQFMGKAPVNLIFLLDYYKLYRLAKLQKAPFTADKSYMHFLIGLEDTICAAQSIETAAWQLGIGTCYIGTVNGAGKEIAELYNLPKYTYPVLISTMGYPKDTLPLRERLPYDMTVFDGEYPDFSDDDILNGFTAKYGDMLRKLPESDEVKDEWMERFKRALLTTFSDEETEEIIAEVRERGSMKYFQYVFGMHYHAKDMMKHGKEVMEMMKEQGFKNFSE